MKKDILKDLLAKPGKKHLVSDFDSSFTGDLSKQDAKEQLAKDIEKLSELQSMLYAQDRYFRPGPGDGGRGAGRDEGAGPERHDHGGGIYVFH